MSKAKHASQRTNFSETRRQTLEALKQLGRAEATELAAVLGETPNAINSRMVRLHRMKPKLVHVVEIVPPRSTGRPSRIWALGDKPDATQKSKTRRVPLVEQEARNRAQKLAEIVPRRHPDIVAFFGPAGGSHVA